MSKVFKVPCAGCGKKFPPEELKPVVHGKFAPGQSWWIDKRCERCAPPK